MGKFIKSLSFHRKCKCTFSLYNQSLIYLIGDLMSEAEASELQLRWQKIGIRMGKFIKSLSVHHKCKCTFSLYNQSLIYLIGDMMSEAEASKL